MGGYLVVWGDESRRDLHGEYFTPGTELALDWYTHRPVLYHHGLDGAVKSALVGAIDTLRMDEIADVAATGPSTMLWIGMGLVLIGFFGLFFFGEGPPNPLALTLSENLGIVALLATLAGYLVLMGITYGLIWGWGTCQAGWAQP